MLSYRMALRDWHHRRCIRNTICLTYNISRHLTACGTLQKFIIVYSTVSHVHELDGLQCLHGRNEYAID
jgi:hypothetical protein